MKARRRAALERHRCSSQHRATSDPDAVESQCARFESTNALALEEVVTVVDGWIDHFRTMDVSGADLDGLGERTDGTALLNQPVANRRSQRHANLDLKP